MSVEDGFKSAFFAGTSAVMAMPLSGVFGGDTLFCVQDEDNPRARIAWPRSMATFGDLDQAAALRAAILAAGYSFGLWKLLVRQVPI